jgi:phospholipid transport system transporter-binding protein
VSDARLTVSGDARWELAGVLDFSSVPQIWASLEKLLQAGGELIVSLSGVSHANSAGLVMLVEARDLARQGNLRLELLDIPEELLDLARMSGCEDLIAVNDD